MPSAVEPEPYHHRRQVLRGPRVSDDEFVILWSGGYNTWTDVDTLFAGISAAMRENPRIKFVSTGGALPGRDTDTFYRFRQMAEQSDLAGRFLFLGWVPTEEMPNYYFESDVGINIDRFSYEMLIGCRYRILDMLRAGLPVVTSLGTEISHAIRDERLGLTFSPGDPEGLKQSLLTLARDESFRKRCAERARQFVVRNRSLTEVMAPLRRWVSDPAPMPRVQAFPAAAVPAAVFAAGFGRGLSLSGAGLRGAVRSTVRFVVGAAGEFLSRSLVRRKAVSPWGIDPREPPQSVLVVRAGSLSLTREVVSRIRVRYPAAEISVLAPEPLVAQTRYETAAPVIPAPGAGLISYRIKADLLRNLHRKEFDTVVVAGEGNRRAELIALLSSFGSRRIEVREDGATHAFCFAPLKPFQLLLGFVAGIFERVALTALLAVVWGSIVLEGRVWRIRRRHPLGPPTT